MVRILIPTPGFNYMSKFLFLNFIIILSSKFYLTICRDIEKAATIPQARNRYCPFLKRKQLTCSAWVATNNTRDDSREYPDKNMSLYYSVTFFPTGCQLLWIPFLTNLKSNICRVLAAQNTINKLCYVASKNRDCTLVPCIFNCHSSVTTHKQERVGFPQSK